MSIKRITERYGEECNYLEMDWSDFTKLRDALLLIGVELRCSSRQGERCVVQMRNVYKQYLTAFVHVDQPKHIKVMADRAVENGAWRR